MTRKTLLAILVAAPLVVAAGVMPKNGDFYITYTDVIVKGTGHELEITRTYNSKAKDIGWYGYGWGSRYETKLVVMPDGSAVVKENGSGATTYYRTEDQAAIRNGVKRIVEVATEREKLTPEAASQMTNNLLNDEEQRLAAVIKYEVKTELPVGTALGNFCGEATLIRLADGYRRKNCTPPGDSAFSIETFDLQGRLIRTELDNGYAVTLTYDADGNPQIRDSEGQSIEMTWTPEHRLARIKTKKETADFKYSGQDLISFALASGGYYRYSYDIDHNLTRIRYLDDSNMFISYSPRFLGMADAVTNRDGTQETYFYHTDPKDAHHFWTDYKVITAEGQVGTRVFEYREDVSPTGVYETAASIDTADSDGEKVIKMDEKGRPIYKRNKEGVVYEYVYHPETNKLILLLSDNKKTEYHYDANGNLTNARSSDGQIIDLEYNKNAEVTRMVEFNQVTKVRRELRFKYDTKKHPSTIEMVGHGRITVEYDSNGRISNVNSTNGAQIGLLVANAFQELLDMISPAGAKF